MAHRWKEHLPMKNELKSYVNHIENYLDGCFDFYEFEPQGILFDSMR